MLDHEPIDTGETENSLTKAQKDLRYLYWGPHGDTKPNSPRALAIEDYITAGLLQAAEAAYSIDNSSAVYDELMQPIRGARAAFERRVAKAGVSPEDPAYVSAFRQCEVVVNEFCDEAATTMEGDALGHRLMGYAGAEANLFIIKEDGDIPGEDEGPLGDQYSATFPFDVSSDEAANTTYHTHHP